MTLPKISFGNIVGLLFSFAVSFVLLFYGHQGLERELARTNRQWYVELGYAIVIGIGLLVAPTIRDRIVPAALTGLKLVKLGRRWNDPKAILTDEMVVVEKPKDGAP